MNETISLCWREHTSLCLLPDDVCQLSMYCAAPEREAGKQMLHYALLGANSRKGNYFSKSIKCQLVTRKTQICRHITSFTVSQCHSVTVSQCHIATLPALSTKTLPNSTKHREHNKICPCHSSKYHGTSRSSSGTTNIISANCGSAAAHLSLKSAQLLRSLYTVAEFIIPDFIEDCTFCCACLWPHYGHRTACWRQYAIVTLRHNCPWHS